MANPLHAIAAGELDHSWKQKRKRYDCLLWFGLFKALNGLRPL